MTWFDFAFLGVLAISVAWGVWRGLVHEMLSLGGWILAFLAANLFAGPLSESLTSTMQPELRVMLAWLAVFVVVLLAASLAGMLLRKFIKTVGLASTDRAPARTARRARAADRPRFRAARRADAFPFPPRLEGFLLRPAARQHGSPAQAVAAFRPRAALALSLTFNGTWES